MEPLHYNGSGCACCQPGLKNSNVVGWHSRHSDEKKGHRLQMKCERHTFGSVLKLRNRFTGTATEFLH